MAVPYNLSDENLAWRDKARALAERTILPKAAHYDRVQEYPWEILEEIKKAGLLTVWIPKEYGGAGGERILNLCIVVEEISRACGGVGVMFAVNALGSFPIIVGGTEEQKRHWLPRIARGETLVAYCLSEKGSGSDAQSMRTYARRDGDHYVLTGDKKWTTNGGAATLYSVIAVTDPKSKARRISAFLVEKGTPGFSIGKVEDKMGIRCTPVVETIFRDCRVPPAALLGGAEGYGFKHAMATLDLARPGVAAQAVGLAQGALDFALVYTSRRRQFGQPVNQFQGIQHRLADMATRVEAARQLVHAAARAADRGHPGVGRISAMAKLFATDTAMWVTTEAVQLFGGYGYMRDYPIEKYMRDAKITQIYEGTNEVQRLVVFRALTRELSELEPFGRRIPEETQAVAPVDGLGAPEAYSVKTVPLT